MKYKKNYIRILSTSFVVDRLETIFEFSKIVARLLLSHGGRRDRIRDDVRVHARIVVYFIPWRGDTVCHC